MKYLVPVICSLWLIGCSDTPPAESTAPAQEAATSETAAPVAAESATPESAPSAPVETAEPAAAETTPAPAPQTPKPAPVAAEKADHPAPKTASVDGGTLFAQKCASCHGPKAEKSALGKSQVIAGWASQQVADALHGYQAGTYGKEMKGIMQAQAKALDAAQVEALASYISAL